VKGYEKLQENLDRFNKPGYSLTALLASLEGFCPLVLRNISKSHPKF